MDIFENVVTCRAWGLRWLASWSCRAVLYFVVCVPCLHTKTPWSSTLPYLCGLHSLSACGYRIFAHIRSWLATQYAVLWRQQQGMAVLCCVVCVLWSKTFLSNLFWCVSFCGRMQSTWRLNSTPSSCYSPILICVAWYRTEVIALPWNSTTAQPGPQ